MGGHNGLRSLQRRRILSGIFLVSVVFLLFKMTRPRSRSCASEARAELKRIIYVRVLEDLARRFEESGVTYMIYGSTLLGSYRHHGRIAYSNISELIDFAVNASHISIVHDILQETSNSTTSFNMTSEDVDSYNLFKCKVDDGGPVIRISHFSETDDKIFFSKGHSPIAFDSVFPLTRRPFENIMLPAPACSKVVLSNIFNLDNCCHFDLNYRPSKCVKCVHLKNLNAFVLHERYTDRIVREQLWQQNRPVSDVLLIEQPLCPE